MSHDFQCSTFQFRDRAWSFNRGDGVFENGEERHIFFIERRERERKREAIDGRTEHHHGEIVVRTGRLLHCCWDHSFDKDWRRLRR